MQEIEEKRTEAQEIDYQIAALMEAGPEPEASKEDRAGRRRRLGGLVRGIWSRWRGWGKKRKILSVLCLLAALALAGRAAAGGGEAGVPVSVTPLTRKDIQEKLSLTGPVSGTDSVDVVSSIHAEITDIYVKEGDRVEKGQLLAALDSTDLAREVEIARNAYELAKANKEEKDKEAALGYEKAVQDFQKASLDHSRNSQLFAAGDISQMELEQSANALNDARRTMEGYRVEDGRGVADASYALQVENAAFELQKKQEELKNTQVKSAIDGTVVRVNSKVGQFADKVEDDKPMFSIENLEELELEIKVSEYSIGRVKAGQKAVITADILDGASVDGEVVKISPTGEEKGGGSTERVIPATIRIDGDKSGLIAGITAKAELLIREAQDAFCVPATAVFEEEDSSYIAVVDNMRFKRIPVDVGVDGDVEVQVTAKDGTALTEGMQVVVSPDARMADGTAVMITEGGGI